MTFNGFCQYKGCGLPLEKDICSNLFCIRHKYNIENKEVKQKIGRYSGRSKSENSFNDYK